MAGEKIPHRCWRRVAEMAPQALLAVPVPSPCQSVCVMHAVTGWCEGCLRTIDEIGAWSRMDDAAKRVVWTRLPERMAQRVAMQESA